MRYSAAYPTGAERCHETDLHIERAEGVCERAQAAEALHIEESCLQAIVRHIRLRRGCGGCRSSYRRVVHQ